MAPGQLLLEGVALRCAVGLVKTADTLLRTYLVVGVSGLRCLVEEERSLNCEFEAVGDHCCCVGRCVDRAAVVVVAVQTERPCHVVTLVDCVGVPDVAAILVIEHFACLGIVSVVGLDRCVECGEEGVGRIVSADVVVAHLRFNVVGREVESGLEIAYRSVVGCHAACETFEVCLADITVLLKIGYGSEAVEFLRSAGGVEGVFLTETCLRDRIPPVEVGVVRIDVGEHFTVLVEDVGCEHVEHVRALAER